MHPILGAFQNQMLPAQHDLDAEVLSQLSQVDILRPEQKPDVIFGTERDLDGNHG